MEELARDAVAPPGVRRSPGLSALFGSLREDRRHTILDLGLASGGQLDVLRGFAAQVRFAGVVPGEGRSLEGALRALPPAPSRPYDVILAWDVLDRLPPQARAEIVGHLAGMSAPGARLFAIARSEEGIRAEVSRFTLVDRDQVVEQPMGPVAAAHPAILPAEMQRLLEPFVVQHAFVLRTGAREYVAVRPE